MAIAPKDIYVGQVASDAAYPYGKARNLSVEGDGTGTPWEEKHVNDLWGFLQSLLDAVDATPSGTPDKVGASQYLDAIEAIAVAQAHSEFDVQIAAAEADIDALEASRADRTPSYFVAPLVLTKNTSDRFEYHEEASSGNLTILQSDITDEGGIVIPISIPFPGFKLAAQGLRVFVKGAGGHGGLPGTMPMVELVVRDITGTKTQLATATDSSATTPEYEALHEIRPMDLAERTLIDNDQLFVKVTGETGENALVNFQVFAVQFELVEIAP